MSIRTTASPSFSSRTSTLSRVVPGTSLTIMRSSRRSTFTSDDLPTFTRPTIAIFTSGGGSLYGVVGPAGSRAAIIPSSLSSARPSLAEIATGSP